MLSSSLFYWTVFSLVKILKKEKFDSDCFLFTVEYTHVISNADFIIDLLELVLKNSLMEFHGEYFQQMFGIIMGTNVAPIIANLSCKTGKDFERKK